MAGDTRGSDTVHTRIEVRTQGHSNGDELREALPVVRTALLSSTVVRTALLIALRQLPFRLPSDFVTLTCND